jgi:ribosomal RNA-processing protein 8
VTLIAGKLRLWKLLEPIEYIVLTIVLTTINDKVTPCDMKRVPLADEALDVVVFSLSLMGKNWPDYNGNLMIAETTKSMKGRLSALREVLTDQGFEIYSDEERGDFTFIEAREL